MTREEIEKLFNYHTPTTESKVKMEYVRGYAKELARCIASEVPDCPDKSASIRLLREAVMTANAAIVLNQTSN